jgi:hypothetical protein
MSKIKIIDNLVEPKKSKLIELIYCLQNSYSDQQLPRWSKIGAAAMHRVVRLTRVSKHQIGVDLYDVIVADLNDDSQLFWLGHWNDGFVKE